MPGKEYRLFSFFLIFIVVISICGCVGLGEKIEGMQTLIELGKSEKYKEQILRQETINFRRAKRYIQGKARKEELSKDIALSKFGEPVLVFYETEGEKWVYKAGNKNWFNAEKIYLFFDTEGRLTNWECLDMECAS